MKLLLASDLHYAPNLAREIAANAAHLPADTYDHQVNGKLYWHNEMLVESGERLLDGLERLALQEQPDLLILLGDLVNVNWTESIAGVAARLNRFPCPLRLVTGNHDICLDGWENHLQDAIAPGTYDLGIRHEKLGEASGWSVSGLGLIYLDLFVRGASGVYRKWCDPSLPEPVEYRAADMAAALALIEAHPYMQWLIIGHFPFVPPEARIVAPGRKIGLSWPSSEPLAASLQRARYGVGMLCGHQHFAHYQRLGYGFHWTLPALVEYPCAAALLEWDGACVKGRVLPVDEELASASLLDRQESWTAGEAIDRNFTWQVGE
jgi:hypothetical protein